MSTYLIQQGILAKSEIWSEYVDPYQIEKKTHNILTWTEYPAFAIKVTMRD